MANEQPTFMDRAVRGDFDDVEDLDEVLCDFTKIWHNTDGSLQLHEFLGMTIEEYDSYLRFYDRMPVEELVSRRRSRLQRSA